MRNFLKSHLVLWGVVLTATFWGAGCGPAESPFQRGMNLLDTDKEAALHSFQVAVATNDHAAWAHYQLAYLYDRSTAEAGLVCWHLQQYLDLSPNAENQKEVRAWLRRSQKRYLNYLTQQLQDTSAGDAALRLKYLEDFAAKQKRWLEELTRENHYLRTKLAEQSTE